MKYLRDLYFANLNAHCHAGGDFEIGAGGIWACYPHRFTQNKFYFVYDGGCTITIEGERFDGVPGRLFFIPAGTAHEYTNDTSRRYGLYWMHFDLLPQEADLFKKLNLPYYVDIPLDGEMAAAFRHFAALSGSPDLSDKIRIKSLLLSLIADYIQIALPEQVGVSDTSDTLIRDILDYMETHIRGDLSNMFLANRFHMHPNHFVRLFKQKTGYTPAKYVTTKRMEKGKNLLEESKLTISEIMEQIGMEDLSHFSKLFKKYYGVSPRQYRSSLIEAVRIPTLEDRL